MNTHRLLAILVAVSLVFLGVPAMPAEAYAASSSGAGSQQQGDSQTPWNEQIDEMLAAGDYEQGEVVAAIAPEIDPELVANSGALAGTEWTEILNIDGGTYEKALGETLPKSALEGAQDDNETVSSCDVEVRSILLVNKGMTTKQLLEELSHDARVLYASPNYAYDADEGELPVDNSAVEGDEAIDAVEAGKSGETDVESDGKTDGEADEPDGGADAEQSDDAATTGQGGDAGLAEEALLATAQPNAAVATQAASSFAPSVTRDVTASADATGLQWASNGKTSAFKGSFDASTVLGVSSWNTGAKNASGIVAVFDTGVDYTHPDLAGNMADMSAYVATAGGTSHGYNAVTTSAEPLDDNGHGTHVAGIVAASTNSYGVSGVACGVKILPVKAGDSNGRFKSSDIARGYDYLKKVVQAGADVRVVNNSWSGQFKDPAVALAVTDLGEMGVLSVFASGNNGALIDGKNYTAASLEYNAYSIVVDSLNMDGTASAFSNRGKNCTDIFAPGSSIISTTKTSSTGAYMPSVMRSTTSTYVTFNGANTLAATKEDGTAILAATDAAHGFDSEGGCLSLTGAQVNSAVSRAPYSSAKRRIVLNVPVDENNLAAASAVGCAVNMTGKTALKGWIEVLCSGTDDMWLSSTDEVSTIDSGNWATLSLDVAQACSRHNRQVALFRDASGKAYIKAAVCLSGAVNKSTGGLKIDSVGVGSTTWHYGLMSGTSMAAPAVSGLAAVLMNQIPNYSSLDATARAWKAQYVLLSAARGVGSLGELCQTGGEASAVGFATAIAADNDPYIGKIEFEDDSAGGYTTVTMRGIGFGSKTGSVDFSMLVGNDITYVSWSDQKIVLRIPLVKGNGKIDASVTNTSGKTSEVASTSTLGNEDNPNEPDEPDNPDKPVNPPVPDPSAPTDPSNPGGSNNAGGGNGVGSGSGDGPNAAGAFAATGDACAPMATTAAACAAAAIVVVCAARFAARRNRLSYHTH